MKNYLVSFSYNGTSGLIIDNRVVQFDKLNKKNIEDYQLKLRCHGNRGATIISITELDE